MSLDSFDELPHDKPAESSGLNPIASSFVKDLTMDPQSGTDSYLEISRAVMRTKSLKTDQIATLKSDSNSETEVVKSSEEKTKSLFQAFGENNFSNSLFRELEYFVHSHEILLLLGYKIANIEGGLQSWDTAMEDWFLSEAMEASKLPSASRSGQVSVPVELEEGEEMEESEEVPILQSSTNLENDNQNDDNKIMTAERLFTEFGQKRTNWNLPLKICSIDCEMCGTEDGLELTRISVVCPLQGVILDTLVRFFFSFFKLNLLNIIIFDLHFCY